MMKCLMFGLACNKNHMESYLASHNNPYSIAHYLFEKKLIDNLEECWEVSHNYLYQSNNPDDINKLIEPVTENITKKTQTTWISYYNSTARKFFDIYFCVKNIIKDFYRKYGNDFFVLSTINYMPIAYATQTETRKYGVKNIIIFTDCSESFAYRGGSNLFKAIGKKIYKRIVAELEHRYDAYINFSPVMNDLVNPRKMPSVVMEGFFNKDGLDLSPTKKYDKFVILFAGSLLTTMGIQNMISAFKRLNGEDIELWIAGGGSAESELKELAFNDSRIKFLGFIDRKKLFEIEKKAHLLINTRNPNDLFTRYSFPSKTFEYLASGTPFLSTKLECYTIEYNDYIIFIENNSEEVILKKLTEIVKWDNQWLSSFGESARKFVVAKKNDIIQSNKVIAFINGVII